MPNIRPSSDLRNHFPEILRECEETHEPVFITQNGYGKLVVMSIEEYRRREAIAALKAALEEGEQCLEDGRTFTLDEVRAHLTERRSSNGKL